MNGFRKYMHVERLGTPEVEGILNGICHIFYKIDGTNGAVWWDEEEQIPKAASRRRVLTLENDNAGFYDYIMHNVDICEFIHNNPNLILYGEFLVPHTLKTYQDDAWNQFYVFDVFDRIYEEYLKHHDYVEELEFFGIPCIPPIMVVENPNDEIINTAIQSTGNYLIKPDMGLGEGIVIKNYDFVNQYGRTTWAKVITKEFREKRTREFLDTEKKYEKHTTEIKIVDKFCTEEFIIKEYDKLCNMIGKIYDHVFISRLIETVYYEFIKEECYNFVKKYNNPSVDFFVLRKLVTEKIKKTLPNIF